MPPFEYAMHRLLWDWLSKHPYSHKKEWPGWEKLGTRAKEDCFACGYVDVLRPHLLPEMRGCPSCPLDWGRYENCSFLYQRWLTARSVEERILAAEKIRDIPLKPHIKELDLSICRGCGEKKADEDYFNSLCGKCRSAAREVFSRFEPSLKVTVIKRRRGINNGED